MGDCHLPTLRARIRTGLALDTISISIDLSSLDIYLKTEEIGFACQVGKAVVRLLAGPRLVDLEHLAELVDVTLNCNRIVGLGIGAHNTRGFVAGQARFAFDDFFY